MTAPTRLLLISLATFVLGVGGASFAYGRFAERRYGPERTFQSAAAAGDGCIVTIGDSRMVQGIDPAALERALAAEGKPRCVAPLAIGALKLPGQAIVLRRYLDARRPSAVVLGVSDGTLLPDEEASDPAEMVGNRAVELLWSNADEREALYRDGTLRTFDARLRHRLLLATSLGSYGSLAWIGIQSLQNRAAGTTDQATNRFGLVADMNALERTFGTGAREKLARWDRRFEVSPWFVRAQRLLAERGVPLVVVSVPMRSSYLSSVSGSPAAERYRTWLTTALAKPPSVTFVDLSSVVADRDFIDGVHVGPKGAAAFSERLAAALPARAGDAGSRP